MQLYCDHCPPPNPHSQQRLFSQFPHISPSFCLQRSASAAGGMSWRGKKKTDDSDDGSNHWAPFRLMITGNLGRGTEIDCTSVCEAPEVAKHTHTHRGEVWRGDRGVDNEQGKHKRQQRESSSSLRASLHLRSTEQSSANISVRLALEIMATHTHTHKIENVKLQGRIFVESDATKLKNWRGGSHVVQWSRHVLLWMTKHIKKRLINPCFVFFLSFCFLGLTNISDIHVTWH